MSVFERLYDSFFRPVPDRADWGRGRYKENEAAAYAVERRIGDVEIRRYIPTLHAEVTVTGDREEALRAGFRTLAEYIFGGNREEQTVAMTVPVQQEARDRGMVGVTEGDGSWTVSFMMPQEFSRETLPEPIDPAIHFVEMPEQRAAVLTLEGRATNDHLDDAADRLRTTLAEAGIPATGPLRMWFYDDPMTPFWKRRNEVALPLASDA